MGSDGVVGGWVGGWVLAPWGVAGLLGLVVGSDWILLEAGASVTPTLKSDASSLARLALIMSNLAWIFCSRSVVADIVLAQRVKLTITRTKCHQVWPQLNFFVYFFTIHKTSWNQVRPLLAILFKAPLRFALVDCQENQLLNRDNKKKLRIKDHTCYSAPPACRTV